MSVSSAQKIEAIVESGERNSAFARLTPFGWLGGLAFIVSLMLVSFFVVGYFVIYWRNADMDFMVIYRSLSLGDGKFVFYEHPAYFTILAVQFWFWFLHQAKLLGVAALSQMPSAMNVAAFDAAMTEVIRAARLLSLLTAVTFVLIFASLAKRLVCGWRVALLATFAFAFSGGMAVHSRILRSELISGCFFAFALMLLMIAARREMVWRPFVIGLSAALCVLALENKTHTILLIATLPVAILPFGTRAPLSDGFWRSSSRVWWIAATAAGAAMAFLFAAMPLLMLGLHPAQEAALQPLLGAFGVYQAGLLLAIVFCMLIYAMLWSVRPAETLTAIFAVIAGASLALTALYIKRDAATVAVVLNPLEQMIKYADQIAVSATSSGGIFAPIKLVASGVLGVMQRYTFVLFTSPRPTVFLTWLILPGIVYVWRRGERQVAIQAAFLMLAAIGVDALGVRRGLKAEYFILTDPLIILAGMLLLDRMGDIRSRKWAYLIGVALIALHVGISQAEPVKLLLKRSGPEGICDWNQHYLPELPLPWCSLPAKR